MMLFSKQNYFPKRSSEKNDVVAFFHISLMSHRALQVTGLSHLLRFLLAEAHEETPVPHTYVVRNGRDFQQP